MQLTKNAKLYLNRFGLTAPAPGQIIEAGDMLIYAVNVETRYFDWTLERDAVELQHTVAALPNTHNTRIFLMRNRQLRTAARAL